jgi:hypothetical protein
LSAAVATPLTLAQFNAIPAAQARALLGSCLDIERWVLEVDAARPYPPGNAAYEERFGHLPDSRHRVVR